MNAKESVEYSYQAEKSIFGIALRAPKGNHSVLGNGSAIIHKHLLNRFLPQIDSYMSTISSSLVSSHKLGGSS